MADAQANGTQKGFLGWVEKTGNRLPDPVFIFIYLIIFLMLLSVLAWYFGWSAEHPTKIDAETGNKKIEKAKSLFSGENIRKLWVEMPATFTHFHPLGLVLVVMLGAGVAERSGFFAAGMRAAVKSTPSFLLTPVVALVAMLGNHAADAGYVVLIPLAGIVFAAAGRHPLAGIACGFAGVSGGFSANLTPGQLDALLFGFTKEGAEAAGLGDVWSMNIAGNWWFIIGLLALYLPLIWFVTDKIIEPRLGKWNKANSEVGDQYENESSDLSAGEKKGLIYGGLATLAVLGVWAFMSFAPNAPLYDPSLCKVGTSLDDGTCSIHKAYEPLYQSLVAMFFVIFLACGWFFGKAAGTIKNHRDLVDMMTGGMKDMAYYLVLAFAAAHFVAMFKWSNLGIISAVHGAEGIKSLGMPSFVVIALMILLSSLLNLFIGSASAKWAILAPVFIPMLMLSNISPEATTAAYRVGDSATNIITPLMVYFPLILIYAQRWDKNFGLGSLTALMIPYSVLMLIVGTLMAMAWVYFGIPLGPDAPVEFTMPTK